ncbi:hypothetical protein KKE06_03020 [Candidatus Micrarchaeota archaeon]|nr:hypothetical protein [Candidatus Micrarchaeota archaeon]MBU1930852.1 hypothetical protein [Candidatus Micrarchaeota archaeon]
MGIINEVIGTITKHLSRFIAFLFFVFTAGMLYGLFISQLDPIFLFVPPLMGLVAFYNEKLAVIMFLGLLLLFI